MVNKTEESKSQLRYFNLDFGDFQKLKQIIPQNIAVGMYFENGIINLYQLRKVELLSKSFKVRLSSGQKLSYQKPLFYQGIGSNGDSSKINLTIFETSVLIMIMTNNGNLVLCCSKSEGSHINTTYVLYNDIDYMTKNNFICGLDSYEIFPQTVIPKNNISKDKILQELSCIDIGIYFECDYYLYQSKNRNVNTVVNFVTGFFNSVNQLFQN